jgi:uncharacterized protein (DUF1778 family)
MNVLHDIRTKRETLNIRILPEERGLIDRAAELAGMNRTQFILDASRHAAEETLLDQALLRVDTDAYAAFLEKLAAPAAPSARLRKTMQTPPLWEQQ